MFSVVPRPQSSIASLAPIAPPPNSEEPARGPSSEAPAAPISRAPATAAPASIAPAPVLPGPAGPSPEPTTSSRRQGWGGGGLTPGSQSTISSLPPATFPFASPNEPVEPTVAAVTVAPPNETPGLLVAPASGRSAEGGGAAAPLPSSKPKVTAQPLPLANSAIQSQGQAAATAGVQPTQGAPSDLPPELQPGSPNPFASSLPAQGEPPSRTPPSSGTSSSSDGEAPDQSPALGPTAVPAEEETLPHGIMTPGPSPPTGFNPAPQISIGESIIAQDAPSHLVLGQSLAAQTLSAGGPAITYSGAVISLVPSGDAVVFGPSTQDIAQPNPAASPVVTLAGETLTANSAFQFEIDGQTIAPGAPAIFHNGQTVSLAPQGSAVIVDGQTQAFQTAQVFVSRPILSVGGSAITANSASQFVIGSQTLSAGSPAITVNGQQLSIAKGGSQVIFGPSTQGLSNPNIFTATQPAVIDVGGGQSVTANGAYQFVIGSQTLKAGSAITAEGSTYSLAPSASAIIINGHTSDLTASRVLATVAPPLVTVGPSMFSANSKSQYIVGSQTLSPGGPAVTISGTRYSLGLGATDLVVGSSTEALKPQYLALSREAPILTIGSSHISADSRGDYIIGTQTLEPGEKITVSGTVLSLASDDNYLMIGTSTEKLHPTMVVASTTRTSLHRTAGTKSAASSSTGFESDLPSGTIPAPTPSSTNGACREQAFWSGMLVAGLAVTLVMV